jgi:hypothetical protein
MGSFARKEHQFLAELGLAPRNPGAFVCGGWGGSGPAVTSTNPSNNQVRLCAAPILSGFGEFVLVFFSLWILIGFCVCAWPSVC